MVGVDGHVIGVEMGGQRLHQTQIDVEMTAAMIEKARAAADAMGVDQVEF